MLLAWFLIGYLACSSAFTIRNPPKQRVSKFYRLARNESVTLESVNYPKDAPGNLRQTWRLECQDKTDRIHLKCEDIRLFQENSCSDYAIVLRDSSSSKEICTTHPGFIYTSTSNQLEVILTTGNVQEAFLKCKATVIGGGTGWSEKGMKKIFNGKYRGRRSEERSDFSKIENSEEAHKPDSSPFFPKEFEKQGVRNQLEGTKNNNAIEYTTSKGIDINSTSSKETEDGLYHENDSNVSADDETDPCLREGNSSEFSDLNDNIMESANEDVISDKSKSDRSERSGSQNVSDGLGNLVNPRRCSSSKRRKPVFSFTEKPLKPIPTTLRSKPLKPIFPRVSLRPVEPTVQYDSLTPQLPLFTLKPLRPVITSEPLSTVMPSFTSKPLRPIVTTTPEPLTVVPINSLKPWKKAQNSKDLSTSLNELDEPNL